MYFEPERCSSIVRDGPATTLNRQQKSFTRRHHTSAEITSRIVTPIGPMHNQSMTRSTLRDCVLLEEELSAFCFVPLIGADAWAQVLNRLYTNAFDARPVLDRSD